MKKLKQYSFIGLLILIILSSLFYSNREGLTNSDASSNVIISTYPDSSNILSTSSVPATATTSVASSVPAPSPSNPSVNSYQMVCENEKDCERYPTSQFNFKGSITQDGLVINKDKTYYCDNGICKKY
jgi:hypothetical protein